MQVTKREYKALETTQGRFQAGMRAPRTASENYVEGFARLRWTIQISGECSRDLA